MRSLPGAGSSPGHVADSVIPAEPVRLDRPRLTALFDAGKAGTAGHVLVSAPAGSGKTVLVRQWTESSRRLAGTRSVMLTAAADDDATSLLRQLRDRAVVSVPEQEPALSPLRPPTQPGAVTGYVTRFLTVTAGSGIPVAIVIDDVHRLGGADCLAVLQALIERAPEGVRVVLATRRDPALPVHRWRLSGVLTGIRAADLALTPGEIRDMAQAYGLELSDRGHALIHECTEGWVGGVRLAIASLSASDDPEAAVGRIAGDQRNIAGYLLEQIVAELDARDREFMLRTSVADELPAALAGVLAGCDDAPARLRDLEHRIGFVSCVDPAAGSYRYHGLLLRVLRRELETTRPALARELCRRASRWHADHDRMTEAIAFAQQAEDWARAAALTCEHHLDFCMRGQSGVVCRIIDRFPLSVVHQDAELSSGAALARIMSLRIDGIDRFLRAAEAGAAQLADPDRRRRVITSVAITRMGMARRSGDHPAVIAAAGAVPPPLTPADPAYRAADGLLHALRLSTLGSALVWSGQHGAAREVMQAGELAGERTGSAWASIGCQAMLSLLDALQGRLAHAERMARTAEALADEIGWSQATPAVAAPVARILVAQERGQLDQAGQALDAAEIVLRQAPLTSSAFLVRLLHARQHLARGRLPAAARIITELRAIEGGPDITACRHLLVRTKLDLARRRRDPAPPARRGDTGESAALEIRLNRAQIAASRRQPEDALRTLTPVPHDEDPAAPLDLQIRWHAWTAYAAHLAGRPALAADALERALDIAAQEGYRLPFTEIGAGLADLLDSPRIRATTEHPDLAEHLLLTLRRQEDAQAPVLSARQRQVLVMLAGPYSLADIAGSLQISVNTVKSHARLIYELLGAEGRNDAARKSRALGLI